MSDPHATGDIGRLARVARLVAALNIGFFAVELTVACVYGSVSLMADSVDFLEDASINLLLLIGLRWSPPARATLGRALAGIILVPSLATLLMAWLRYASSTPPEPLALGLTGLAALLINGFCAYLLAAHRNRAGSLAKAAFLSARNDTIANIAIIAAGCLTAATRSTWPDLIVGLGIAALNAGAATEVWTAAREERDVATS